MDHHEIAWFEPKYKDTVRLVVDYNGALRPFFWFSVGDDQSVYLGPRTTSVSIMKSGQSARRTEHGVRFDYDDGDVLDPSEFANPSKLSFHSSGMVNAPDGRSLLGTKNVAGGQLLAHLLFQHQKAFTEIATPRKKDVVLRQPIHDDRPVVGRLIKYLGRPTSPLPIANCEFQIDLGFGYPESAGRGVFTLV